MEISKIPFVKRLLGKNSGRGNFAMYFGLLCFHELCNLKKGHDKEGFELVEIGRICRCFLFPNYIDFNSIENLKVDL